LLDEALLKLESGQLQPSCIIAKMVLLTMTASIVELLAKLEDVIMDDVIQDVTDIPTKDEQSLATPVVGNPVSHGQIIDIWKKGRTAGLKQFSLENLLQGACVYVPPPPPKPEPVRFVFCDVVIGRRGLMFEATQTDEYKALMARLRREEEERSYERMLAASSRDPFASRHASSSQAHAFSEVNRAAKQDLGEEHIDQAEIQRQLSLVVNFLVSVGGCAAAIWIAAQWWNTTTRLFLTLGGSLIVAIAEVAVYSAWSWRMAEGEKRQQKVKEVREVVKTWVLGDDTTGDSDAVLIKGNDPGNAATVRKRVVGPS
jgi:TMEM199 family protein